MVESNYDIAAQMKRMVEQVKWRVENEQRIHNERCNNPNWEYSSIHILYCPLSIFENLSEEEQYHVLRNSYVGHQWVWVGEGKEPCEG